MQTINISVSAAGVTRPAIIRLSALVETEAIVSVSCVQRLVAQLASQKGLIVLGNLHSLGLPPSTLQQIYTEAATLRGAGSLEPSSLSCLEKSGQQRDGG